MASRRICRTAESRPDLYLIPYDAIALIGKQPNGQLSAAPLASVWRVEDGGRRQPPGNARAADPWSGRSVGLPGPPEGCASSCCQQADAFCGVNRAQTTNRASGVSCTAWLGR